MRVNIAVYNYDDDSLEQVEGRGDTPGKAVKNAIDSSQEPPCCESPGKEKCDQCQDVNLQP